MYVFVRFLFLFVSRVGCGLLLWHTLDLSITFIVIRPADKGSGVVVVDTKYYIWNLEGEVIGKNSYRETDGWRRFVNGRER